MTPPNDVTIPLHPKPQPRHVDYDRPLEIHITPKTLSDKIAYAFVRFLRFFADKVFAKRYGHRAVVLETCLLYTSPSPRDRQKSRMPSSA